MPAYITKASLSSRNSVKGSSENLEIDEEEPQLAPEEEERKGLLATDSSSQLDARLWRPLVVSLAFSVFGWYAPEYLSHYDEKIIHRPIPYQTTAAGDVILDPTLNYPFVHPATVSCK